jgi:RHS repeat-associated protein
MYKTYKSGTFLVALISCLVGINAANAANGNLRFSSGRPALSQQEAEFSPGTPRSPTADAQANQRSTVNQPLLKGAGAGVAATKQAPKPGVIRPVLPPVSLEESLAAARARVLPANLNEGVSAAQDAAPASGGTRLMSAMRIGGDTAAAGPVSITELARALRNDPNLIYEYVRNNIEYYPVWGVQKGALGAIMENQGTEFDQAMLMVQLLRAAGYTASYMHGVVRLSAAQLRDWYGYDTNNACGVLALMGQGQIPVVYANATVAGNCPGTTAALTDIGIGHIWVKATIGGTSYVFDPSYKPHTRTAGTDFAGNIGYAASAYLSSASAGATISGPFVSGFNRTNIRSQIDNYSRSMAQWLRAYKPASSLDDVIGGKTIVPETNTGVRQSVLPYQDTTYAVTEMAEIPDQYKPTLRILYQGIDQTYTSDALYGKRLTITYNAGNQPVLMLNGVAVGAPGTAVSPGAASTVTFIIWHNAYPSTQADQYFDQTLRGGGTYVINNGWGPSSRGMAQGFLKTLQGLRASGTSDKSEAVLGSSLALLGAQWMGQATQFGYIAQRIAGDDVALLQHHMVGVSGYRAAPYVDLPGNATSVLSVAANAARADTAFRNWGMHTSVLESTTVSQTHGVPAMSTISLLDKAVASGLKIYDATNANYAGTVQPKLVNCAAMTSTFADLTKAGQRVLMPERCDITEGVWKGTGYMSITAARDLGFIVGDGYAGGYPTTNLTEIQTASTALSYSCSAANLTQNWGVNVSDPIDIVAGSFLYENTDLDVGVGPYPNSLPFRRLYSSGMRNQPGPTGKGWTHNFDIGLRTASDGFQGLGEDSALDAVNALVEARISHDLLSDVSLPAYKLVLAAIGQNWLADRNTNNTVIVNQGLNGEVFVRLPDGTYNPPPGHSARLIRNTDGSYVYETLNRGKLALNAAGKPTTYSEPSGVQVNFGFTGTDLTSVQNSLGRSLTFLYAGGRISQVSDGTRVVKYAYDSAGNLTSFTNTLGQAVTYQYDQPGRLSKVFYPSFPTVAGVANTYDSLGRVQTQTSATGKVFNYYFAGSRAEEVGPVSTSRVYYLDAMGKVLRARDPLGNSTTNTYDAQSRLVRAVAPEGNAVEYTYDDATCGSGLNRCTHNVATVRRLPKPGSALTPLVQYFYYESAFNRVSGEKDARGNTTAYTYTAQGFPATVTAPGDAAGVAPVTTYGYASFSPAGFPAFYLPQTVTVKTSATNSVVTTTAYNAGNKFVPASTTVDSGTGKLNLVTAFTYDGIGNLSAVDGPRADVTDVVTSTYDSERRPTEVKNALGKLTRTAYDADGRPVRMAAQVGAQWLVSCKRYSTSGKVVRSWGPSLMSADTSCPAEAAPVAVVDAVYDDLDRPKQVTRFLPATEGGNRVTSTTYYADDSVLSQSEAVGTTVERKTTYTRNANGTVRSVADPKNNRTAYTYDGFDRLAQVSYPSPTTAGSTSSTDYEAYTYDANGNVLTLRRRNGQTITQTFDKLNRLLTRAYSAAADNVQFAYDLRGLRTASQNTNGSHAITYAWDNAGRLLNATSGGKTLSYQYDAAGNRTRMTWPDAFYVTTSYDALNRPVDLRENGSTTVAPLGSYAYDDLSRRATVTYGNGTRTQFAYGAQGDASTLTHFLSSSAEDVQYTYTRNAAREITGVASSNNKYQWAGATVGTLAYAANGLDQYTTVAGGAIQYDASGNLTSDGTWTYTYDADNRLRTAAKTGTSASLTYDAEGRLRLFTVGGVPNTLLYDGSDLVAEYDSTALLRRYVHGPGMDEPMVWYEGSGTASKSWLHGDHQGSIVAQSNAAGAMTATYTYGPFGEPGGTGTSRFRYTGQQYLSALRLYYYKARFYSAVLGRFLQTDPIGTRDDRNLYAYVGNNPLNFTDPTGLSGVSLGFQSAGQTLTGLWQPGSLADGQSINVAANGGTLLASANVPKTEYDVPVGGATVAPSVPTSGAAPTSYALPIGSPAAGSIGSPPPNLSPVGAGRAGAFNAAKSASGIPTSQQPSAYGPNLDRRGNAQPGRSYEFAVPASGGGTKTVIIRDDSGGHNYGPGSPQNRGPHFNDPAGNHYDY